MSKKIQIWLREDQIDCAARALAYVAARFEGWAAACSQDNKVAIIFACELASERSKEVMDILNKSLEKARRTVL